MSNATVTRQTAPAVPTRVKSLKVNDEVRAIGPNVTGRMIVANVHTYDGITSVTMTDGRVVQVRAGYPVFAYRPVA